MGHRRGAERRWPGFSQPRRPQSFDFFPSGKDQPPSPGCWGLQSGCYRFCLSQRLLAGYAFEVVHLFSVPLNGTHQVIFDL